MKKLLLSLLAVSALTLSTKAQTEKGTIMVGGNVEFNSAKNDGAPKSNTSFAVVPSVGYFVADNIALGTGVGYQFAKSYSFAAAGSSTKSDAFVISPFARAYKGINDQFKFFGQLSVPMSFGSTKVGDVDGNNYVKVAKNNTVGVALSPGVAFFPSKKIGIEFAVNGISYNDNTFKDGNGNNATGNKNFSIGANFFAPKIGVQFFL